MRGHTSRGRWVAWDEGCEVDRGKVCVRWRWSGHVDAFDVRLLFFSSSHRLHTHLSLQHVLFSAIHPLFTRSDYILTLIAAAAMYTRRLMLVRPSQDESLEPDPPQRPCVATQPLPPSLPSPPYHPPPQNEFITQGTPAAAASASVSRHCHLPGEHELAALLVRNQNGARLDSPEDGYWDRGTWIQCDGADQVAGKGGSTGEPIGLPLVHLTLGTQPAHQKRLPRLERVALCLCLRRRATRERCAAVLFPRRRGRRSRK